MPDQYKKFVLRPRRCPESPIINIYGARRSGLHCITNDIIYHYNQQHHCQLIFYNDQKAATYDQESNRVFLFEDEIDYIPSIYKEYNVIIIRDIYDNIISRIGKNASWSKVNTNYLDLMKKIIKEFLYIDNNIPNKILINYNLYISDILYRSQILKEKFFIDKINPFSKKIPGYGGGKTFKRNQDRTNVKIETTIYDTIIQDIEFLSLTKQYFGYDISTKLAYHLNK